MLKRKIYYSLPLGLRKTLRRLYYLPYDIKNSGSRHKYEPPKGKINIGSGDFIAQGQKQLDELIKFADLAPNNDVLDIGCGMGRTAVALTEFLDNDSKYEGFDVIKEHIDWCQKISIDHTNFNFKYIPLENDLYSNSGEKASIFKYPYPEHSFNLAFLYSVFTHMPVNEIEHYLSEIFRVLKPEGKCLATFFTYNSESESLISDKKNYFAFPYLFDNYRLMDNNVENANIAIEENYLRSIIEKIGFSITKVEHGFWKDPNEKLYQRNFQDIFVIQRPSL